MLIGPPVPKIQLFQKLTLKIQGQGHGWGQSSKSQCESNILSTYIPLVPCQSALPFLRYSIYKFWPWKSKVKVRAQGHKVGILGSMVSHQRVIVGLSQSAPAVGWGSPLHAWQALVNWIGCARYLNRGYRYGARGMHYHILLRPCSKNYYTYNNVVKNTYSPCHKDACVKISIGNTEWLLRYKGVSSTCFSGEKACFHQERWLGETLLGPSSRPRITTYHYTRSTQKSPGRQQNAWFDTKKPGSTQKCLVRHKNALPSMHQWTLPLSNIPPPLLWEIFFFSILFQYFVFKNQ